ncbi:MAG: DUF167 domain-containing protein [Rhodobacter sp.]|jgi:uncharacterized protein YggU (UPF0235/DUF167 family)|nr:DUF167 domain-containing protein [Rhodobacter sp.]MBK8439912.1 DUF167 domain-containing protein [Rhodobacter sp.]
MARPPLPDLSARAIQGTAIAVRVTPNARTESLQPGDPIRIAVTVVPEDGKATAAAQALLARALGVPKSRLTLLRGASSRDKVFRLD